jgi:hypothetical protein
VLCGSVEVALVRTTTEDDVVVGVATTAVVLVGVALVVVGVTIAVVVSGVSKGVVVSCVTTSVTFCVTLRVVVSSSGVGLGGGGVLLGGGTLGVSDGGAGPADSWRFKRALRLCTCSVRLLSCVIACLRACSRF